MGRLYRQTANDPQLGRMRTKAISGVRLTPYSAYFFSRNSVFPSQQFSQNSVFQPVSAKILPAERGQLSGLVALCDMSPSCARHQQTREMVLPHRIVDIYSRYLESRTEPPHGDSYCCFLADRMLDVYMPFLDNKV